MLWAASLDHSWKEREVLCLIISERVGLHRDQTNILPPLLEFGGHMGWDVIRLVTYLFIHLTNIY